MAKLTVTTDGNALAVEIDGEPVPDLEGVDVSAHRGQKLVATLTLSPDELKIDTDAFMWIKAKMREQQGG